MGSRSGNVGVFLLLVYIGFLSQPCVKSASILGVFPVAGKSINILYDRLVKGLLDAGHDVTMISAYKHKFQNVNGTFSDVVLTGFAEDYERMLDSADLLETPEPEQNPVWESALIHELFFPIFNNTFKHPNFQKFLKEDHKFDLVLSEYVWSDSLLVFPWLYKCPSVIFSSMGGVNPWVNEMVGNPMPISYVSHYWMLGEFSKGLSFFQRLHNLLFFLYDPVFNYQTAYPDHNQILKSAIPNAPDVAQLYYETPSLVLLGSHSSLRQAIPLSPNTVEIGGFHIDPPKKLPKDLQDFLDSASEGAIFFSMGSHIKSKNFSPEKKRMILNVLGQLKQKILWKFEDEVLPGKPDNVLIRKWLPQMDILAHPNIKLFIAHGGYGSTLETIYHGVPTLMIPVFADQFNNANQAEARGFALKLSYGDKNFTEQTFKALITEMLDNPKYSQKAKLFSGLFHDRPMKPLDAAIYWIEYVIRHKGADHLKLAGAKLPWYQFYMVDVLLFLVTLLGVVFYVLLWVFKAIFLRGRKPNKIKKK